MLPWLFQAENMIAHKDDIYSRPKRTWFATEKEKKSVAKAAKVISYCTIVVYLYSFVSLYIMLYMFCLWVGISIFFSEKHDGLGFEGEYGK